MKNNEIFERFKKKIGSKIQDFKQGRQSWRLKEWYNLQSLIYLIYSIGSFIFVRLLANSSPDNNNYDHFVNDPNDNDNNTSHCGITPIFNFIPIPGSYLLIIYSVYLLCIISIIVSLLSFILGFSFRYFSKIPRSYFFSPSKKTKFLGFCCKILPMMIRILNLLFILFLLIPFIYITTSGACYRRLVRFERNKVQNCRTWVSKCAKDHRILGRHLECSLRKNFKHFPTEIVEDPTIGENLDILIGGPMPLLCPMCNEIRMDPKSALYKGEAYVDQLKSSISKMESNINDRSIYQTESLSLIQLNSNWLGLENNKKEYTLNEYKHLLKPILFSNVTPFIKATLEYNKNEIRYLFPSSLIQISLNQNQNIKNKRSIESNNEKNDAIKNKKDLVSLNEPINIDLNSNYNIQDYDTRTINIPTKVNIPSKYKSIVEKYAAALSSQVSGDSLVNEEDIHRININQRKNIENKDQTNVDKTNTNEIKTWFKFSGDLNATPLSFEETHDLNREFEAARYQIQVTMHEGSNFSRSIFIFMLISLIFWALARFFSFVIFQATQTEACFYVPTTKRALIWSKLRDLVDILS